MFTNHNIDTWEKALLGLLECGHNRYFTVYIPMGDTDHLVIRGVRIKTWL